MIQSIKKTYGDQLAATDGPLGAVKDYYFDDRRWAVRYLVADTGTWLPGRLVLIAPHALDHLYQSGKLLFVNLTRQQIENSPGIATHEPVSRQYEARYFQYYGWPNYWQGDGLWGHSGFPMAVPPAASLMSEQAVAHGIIPDSPEAHLRSTQAVAGYQIQATDGIAGHVNDFLMDEKSWTIQSLVVQIGHRLTGREIEVPTRAVGHISYEASTIFVNLTLAELAASPQPVPQPV
jgi:sporulation protein YlmC with PRC-barrel domain